MRGQLPWDLLEIESHRQVNDIDLGKAQRRMSSKYHPDRFVGQSDEVKALAAECFELVMDAHSRMEDPVLREELKARLEAAERGEKYVTDAERQEAEVAYARGQLTFRRRQWAEALAAYEDALRLNPEPWRYTFMRARAAYHVGQLTAEQVAMALMELEGPRGPQKAEVLFEAAEILLRDGREEQGYDLCGKIVEVYPDHVGARRRLRMRDLRQRKESAPSGGLLSSLFGRRKD